MTERRLEVQRKSRINLIFLQYCQASTGGGISLEILKLLTWTFSFNYLTKLSNTDKTFRFRRITPNDIIQSIANIPTRFFKDAPECIAPSLSVLFNKSLNLSFKVSRISAIYKGKGSRSYPDHYRPISVLLVVARLFEKLLHNQLFTFLKTELSHV